METRSKRGGGYFCTIAAGMMWGLSDACGQYVFSHYVEFSAIWLTVIRMLTAGVILIPINWVREREAFTGIWKNRKDAIQLVLFGICGLMMSQFTTFQAIQTTNAGTATVLQALGPVLIMLVSCLLRRRVPKWVEVVAVLLAVFGTFVLATHGNPSSMVISPQGLMWGLASACSAVVYTMLSERIARKWGSMVVIGFGMLIGGITLACVTRVWTLPLDVGWDGWLAMSGTVFFGTLVAFNLYVTGCARIGAVKGSMLATVEPVTATILAVIWLGSTFAWIDILGFVCILTTVFLLTKKEKSA